jgi:hypothetical protein
LFLREICSLNLFISFPPARADTSLSIGLVGTLIYGFSHSSLQPLSSYPMMRVETTPRSFGSVAFLFCVNFMVYLQSSIYFLSQQLFKYVWENLFLDSPD